MLYKTSIYLFYSYEQIVIGKQFAYSFVRTMIKFGLFGIVVEIH